MEDWREQLVGRLMTALARAYQVIEARAPLPATLVVKTMRPRLERSLAADPERAVAVLVWAWARIPELVGDTVDLTDTERVLAIVARVELYELGLETAPIMQTDAASEHEPPEPMQDDATAATDAAPG
jgi:hypothetical protein